MHPPNPSAATLAVPDSRAGTAQGLLAVPAGFLALSWALSALWSEGVTVASPLFSALIAGRHSEGLGLIFAQGLVWGFEAPVLASLAALAALIVTQELAGQSAARAEPVVVGAGYGLGLAAGTLLPVLGAQWRQVILLSPSDFPVLVACVALGATWLGLSALLPRLAAAANPWPRTFAAPVLGLLAGGFLSARAEPLIAFVQQFAERNRQAQLGWLLIAALLAGMGLLPGILAGVACSGRRRLAGSLAGRAGLSAGLLAAAALTVADAVPQASAFVACTLGLAPLLLAPGLSGAGVATAALGARGAPRPGARAPGLVLLGSTVAAVGLLLATAVPRQSSCARPDEGVALQWIHNDETDALARAKAEGKPLAIYFHADWCKPCHQLEDTTLRDPKVVKALSSFVLMKVDVTTEWEGGEKLKEKYQTDLLPGFAFTSPAGALLPRNTSGFVPARQFLENLEAVLHDTGTAHGH